MKAVVLDEYGGPEKLVLRDVPDPEVGADQIKVRVTSTSVNPIDWKLRSGSYKAFVPLHFPAILGKDAAGTVVDVGPQVSVCKVGDRMMGLVNSGYAELVVAPTEMWTRVPEGLDLADAGALPLVLLTGAQLIEGAADVQAGDVVLVVGALGSVGRVAAYLARSRGAKVYAGVRGAQKVQATKELDVDGVVALDDADAVAGLPALDAIADTVGGDITQKLLAKMKRGGKIGSIVGEPPGAAQLGLVVKGMYTHPDAKRLGELAQAVAERRLIIPIAKRFPLAQAAEAHRVAEHGAGGKVLLTT